MNEEKKYISYSRKSSDREDRQILSLSSQDNWIRKEKDKNNFKIVANFSEHKSAYKPGREEFNKMIKMIEEKKANSIITFHFSRLARNMIDGGAIIDLMDRGLLKEIHTSDSVFKSSSDDKFMLGIHFAVSKKSSDDTSSFVSRDITAKLLKGEFPSHAPIGYLNIDSEGKISGKQYSLEKQIALSEKKDKLKRIEIDPILSDLVIELFNLAGTGNYSLNDLRDISLSMGLFGHRSKKKISKQTMSRILTNKFYYGAIVWKENTIEPYEMPEENRHEPLISKELFEQVQEKISKRFKPLKAKNYYPFSNYMTCGYCGNNISGLTAKGHSYYRCMKCKKISYVREDEVEKQISESLENLTIDKDFYELALEEVKRESKKEKNTKESIIKKQNTELKRCQQRLDNLLKLKIDPNNINSELISNEEFIKEKKNILADRELLQKEIEKKDINEWGDNFVNYIDFMKELKNKFISCESETKKEIFQFMYYNPILKDKKILIRVKNPHKYIYSLKKDKKLTITVKNDSTKTKITDFCSDLSYERTGRDSNPQLPP